MPGEDHENLMKFHQSWVEGNTLYLQLEYYEGMFCNTENGASLPAFLPNIYFFPSHSTSLLVIRGDFAGEQYCGDKFHVKRYLSMVLRKFAKIFSVF